MKTIVLTGGGSAGHVTPNLALIPTLQQEGWKIEYIGSKQGIEKELVENAKVSYHGISSGKLRRYKSIENIKDPFKVMKGLLEAYTLLFKLKPSVVFSKGGYVTVPVVLAAKLLRIPVIIHESDITPGLANKIASKGAKTICVNFPETLQYVGKKGVLTGTPIRQELFEGNKVQGKKLCGFMDNKPVLFMMGGSLGAVRLNECLRKSLNELTVQFNIIHICGKGNVDETLKNKKGYCQFEYVSNELTDLFSITDVMLSRAGANAIAEIIALNIPTLFVPLSQKASRGDQILNANSMQKQGVCMVLQEEELTEISLVQNMKELYKAKELYKEKMKQNQAVSGLTKVMEEISKYK